MMVPSWSVMTKVSEACSTASRMTGPIGGDLHGDIVAKLGLLAPAICVKYLQDPSCENADEGYLFGRRLMPAKRNISKSLTADIPAK